MERYEDTQDTTDTIVEELIKDLEERLRKQKEQAQMQFDNNVYFLFDKLRDSGYSNAEEIAKQARDAFGAHPHWKGSEDETRQIRAKVYGAIFRNNPDADMDKVTEFVSSFFDFLKDQTK